MFSIIYLMKSHHKSTHVQQDFPPMSPELAASTTIISKWPMSEKVNPEGANR